MHGSKRVLQRIASIDGWRALVPVRPVSRAHALLVATTLVTWAGSYALMSLTHLMGDEYSYVAAGRAIAAYFTGRDPMFDHMIGQVVDVGAFMPGVSILVAPVYLFSPDADVALVRATMGLVSLALWLWTFHDVRRFLGLDYALWLILFPVGSLAWHMLGSTAAGEVPAGLLMVIALARAHRIGMTWLCGERPTLGDILRLELVLGFMVYMRGPTLLVVVALHVALACLVIVAGPIRVSLKRLGLLGAGTFLFATLLLPWNVASRHVLGETVAVTTTIPLAMAGTFGRLERVCAAPCTAQSFWASSRVEARRRGVTELEVQREWARTALEGLTLAHYTTVVREHFTTFLFQPTGYARAYVLTSYRLPARYREPVAALSDWVTIPLHFTFLLAFVLANAVVVRRDPYLLVMSVLIKLMTACIMVQPFIQISHARYWPQFAPLMGLCAAFLMNWWRVRRQGSADPSDSVVAPRVTRVLVGVQCAYVSVAAIIILALLVI